MENIIIIRVIAVVLVFAVRGSLKHLKGEGGCCGGESAKPVKKKLKNKKIMTYIVSVDGMHCQNCANKVCYSINDIKGASAEVRLSKKEAVIKCDSDVDINEIKRAVEKNGYTVTGYRCIKN